MVTYNDLRPKEMMFRSFSWFFMILANISIPFPDDIWKIYPQIISEVGEPQNAIKTDK